MKTEPLLTIHSTTYNQALHHLPLFLHSCALQTDKRFKVVVHHDGNSGQSFEDTAAEMLKWLDPPFELEFKSSPVRHNDYGHSLRADALNFVDTKYLNWNNSDNYLTPMFVQFFLEAMEANELDFAWSNVLHNYPGVNGDGQGPYNVLVSYPSLNRIDIMNFVVKTSWAKKVGFNHRGTGADGLFVQELISWYGPDLRVAKIEAVPCVHN